MDQNDTGIDPAQPLARGCTAMRRTIVHDPKQSFAGTVWFLRQHLLDQSAKGGYAGLRFTPAQYIPPTYIPGSQILQGTAALVLVFAIGRSAHCRRQGPRGEKVALRPRPDSSSKEKSPVAHRRRHRGTERRCNCTRSAASTLDTSGC